MITKQDIQRVIKMSWQNILKKDKVAEIMDVIDDNKYDLSMREHLIRFGIPLPAHDFEEVRREPYTSLKIITDNLDKPDFVDYIHRILVTGNELDDVPNLPLPFDFLKAIEVIE